MTNPKEMIRMNEFKLITTEEILDKYRKINHKIDDITFKKLFLDADEGLNDIDINLLKRGLGLK
jgi:hypothetical protein